MAIVAAHLGVVNEDEINNMSIPFFEDVLKALGHKLTYDAVVNYAGNSFCEKSWDMIQENHPMAVGEEKKNKVMHNIADFFSSAECRIKGE